jgi:putative peptidoglycan lipid II flippase
MATNFGTGMVASAFSVAYRLPNMFRNLLAEGTLSQSFMPIFSEYDSQSKEEARIMTGSVLSFLFFLLSIFIFLFLFLAPYFLPILVGGTEEYSSLVIELSFILFFLILTASLSSIFMAISNSQDRYFIPSLSPIVLNLSYILVFVLVFPFYDSILERVKILSVGVVFGGFLQLVLQFTYVWKNGYLPLFNLNWKHPAIQSIFKLMLPAVLGGGFYQLGLLVDIFIANYIQNQNPGLGAVVSLDYSQRLVQLPTGIIGVALATTILPALLKKVRNQEDFRSISEEIGNSFRFAIFLTVPASIGLLTMGRVILDSIFYGGRWDHHATEITLLPLGFYALAIPFFSMNKILISSFYAFKDTKTPLKTQAISFFLSIIIAISLMNYLKQGSIALASAIASCVTFSVMSIFLRKHNVHIQFLENFRKVLKMLIPFLVLGSWTYLIGIYFYQEELMFLENIGLGHANSSRLILILGMIPAMIMYFLSSFLLGVGEIRQIARRTKK